MDTPFTFHGDLEGAVGLVQQAAKKLQMKWDNTQECLSQDDIKAEEATLRLLHGAETAVRDVLTNFKAIAAIRSKKEN